MLCFLFLSGPGHTLEKTSTSLLPSESYTCFLVDRYYKVCHLFPLKGPPSAMETAGLMFNRVFCNFSLPEDIFSDHLLGLESILHTHALLVHTPLSASSISVVHRLTIGYRRARGSGNRLIIIFKGQCAAKRVMLMARWTGMQKYQPGQKVWLSTRDIKLHLPCKKISPRYIGLFSLSATSTPTP